MSDEQELQDSLTPEGDENAVNNLSPEPASEPMVPKSSVDKLYARVKQAEEESKRMKQELAGLKTQQPASVTVPEELRREIAVTKLIAQGYNEEEAQFILKAGGLENPYVKAGIQTLRGKQSVEQARPPASQVAMPGNSPEVSINKLDASGKSKAWQDALDKAATKRAGQVI